MLSLTNKVALITGAAKGVGRATAKLFHQQNAHVVGVDLDLDGLKSLKSELGNNVDIYQADVSNETQVKNYIDKTYNTHGKINILCNIAGGPRLDSLVTRFHTTDLPSMRKTCDINLWGSLYNCYYMVPYMLETIEKEKTSDNYNYKDSDKLSTPCCIINTSSSGAERAVPGMTDYVMSKHGINGLTYSIAAEYSSLGIRCNGIEPGGIDTPLMKAAFDKTRELAGEEAGAAMLDGFTKLTGLKRAGQAEEIANVFLFLASDASSFITGSVILADGGSVKIIPAP